jgi:predicted AAA+ superfamily ATPase
LSERNGLRAVALAVQLPVNLRFSVIPKRHSGGKKEVDFVLKENGNKLLGIELKYQNRINSSDYRGLTAFERGILISKNKFDLSEKYATVPASLFLLLL